MLETVLSPILGLTLIQMVEYLGIAGLSVGMVTAVMLWIQIRRQRMVDSAIFTATYLDKIIRNNQDVILTLDGRQKDTKKSFANDRYVVAFLNELDNAVQLTNDGVIDKSQALNTLRITLRRLKNDNEVKRIIKEKRIIEKKAFDKVTAFWNKEID